MGVLTVIALIIGLYIAYNVVGILIMLIRVAIASAAEKKAPPEEDLLPGDEEDSP